MSIYKERVLTYSFNYIYVYNIDSSKRFSNSMYNLSDSEYKYRVKTSEKIFSYKKLKNI